MPRRMRAGVRRSAGNGSCQGKRTSATWSRARRNCTCARSSNQVQRSAACGRTQLRRGPFERLLEEAEGVLNGEAGDVRLPHLGSIGWA
jgi:hypothetical protein